MISRHLAKPAQEFLQLVLDGKIKDTSDALQLMEKHAPEDGFWGYDDLCELTNFFLEAIRADNIPAARELASKHWLDIAY